MADKFYPLSGINDRAGGVPSLRMVDDGNGGLALTIATAEGGAGIALASSEEHIGQVGGTVSRPSASFTRPNDTTPYSIGDLVANSTTAGSVNPLSFTIARFAGKGGMLRRVRLRKTGTSITNASFRAHFYSVSPTMSNGDNGAWLTNQCANYVGSVDTTLDKVFTDGSGGNGVPSIGSEINFTADTYYVVLQALAAYTPVAQEVFTLSLELLQN